MGFIAFFIMLGLVLFLFVIVFILNLVFRVLNIFRRNPQPRKPHFDYDESDNKRGDCGNGHRQQSGKVFADDEGEYVDFEEIKD